MRLFPHWYRLRKMPSFTEDRSEISSDARTAIGDFHIFATKLAHPYERGAAVPTNASHSSHCNGKDTNRRIGTKRMTYDVFLGGSCNPTTWRSDIAIPTLQSLGITYYNPQVSQWGPELVAQEYEAKQTARVLLFVLDNQTRNTAGIIEAAQLAATRSDSLVLVIYPYRQGQAILGETVSAQEYCDLMNGLLVLEHFVKRQRIPIFESVSVALNCTSKILREAINVQDLNEEDGTRTARISLSQNGTSVTSLREIFKSMDTNDTGTVRLSEALVVLRSSAKGDASISELVNAANESDTHEGSIKNVTNAKDAASEQRITFDRFCALSTEFARRAKSNGTICESEIPSVWSILCGKASKFVRRAFVHPLDRFLDWTNSIITESEKRDLYIGAVGKDLSWLEFSAAPLIESSGLSLHRPNTNEYSVRALPHEVQRMKNSRLILLIVPHHKRGIAIMTLAAHLIGLRAKLVMCIQPMPQDSVVSGEKLTEQATRDYNRGRMYLSDYATREGVPVFQNIADALQHAIRSVQSLPR